MQVSNHYATYSLEFVFCTLALIAAVVGKIFKTRVTLGNIYRVLLNVIESFHYCSS